MRFNRLFVAAATVTLMATTSFAVAQEATSVDTPASTSKPTSDKKALHAQNRAAQEKIRQSLVKAKGLDTSNISVIVRGDKVTLAGSVKDASEIDSAVNAATAAADGKTIDNRLTIRQPGK